MSDIQRSAKVEANDEDEARLASLFSGVYAFGDASIDLTGRVGCYSGWNVVVASVKDAYSNAFKSQGLIVPMETATYMTDCSSGPPSAYPRALSHYVAQLQEVNHTLETRVDLLERELAEVRAYLPTIRKLTCEYGSAASRVSALVDRLGRKYNPAEAWKVALQKDALTGPITDEEYSEIL
jgi:hypothetical protein